MRGVDRVLLVLRYVLALVLFVGSVISTHNGMEMWTDLTHRADWMVEHNELTTTTAGVLLSFYGGLVALTMSMFFLLGALWCYPAKRKRPKTNGEA